MTLEIADDGMGNMALRNSERPREVITFTRDEWLAFLAEQLKGFLDEKLPPTKPRRRLSAEDYQ